MYLLYEKEFDEVVRKEQKKLLRWIQEAVKLNPGVDITTVLTAAAKHVDDTTYQMKNVKEVTEPVEPSTAVVEEPASAETSVETYEIEQDYQPISPPVNMYEPSEPSVVEDYAPPVELQQPEQDFTPVKGIDELVDAQFSGQSVPLNDTVDFTQKGIVPEVEEQPQLPAGASPVSLPSRTAAQEAADIEARKRLEDNLGAIYRDPTEIQDL